MSLSLRLLGTSASRPTIERNVASVSLVHEGETLMFDCGEGTQRQMMRYGVSFSLRDIYFTHFHADHLIGVIGLMRTMALQGRTDPLRLLGPVGGGKHLRRAKEFGLDRLTFPLEILELELRSSGCSTRGFRWCPFSWTMAPHFPMGYAIIEPGTQGAL